MIPKPDPKPHTHKYDETRVTRSFIFTCHMYISLFNQLARCFVVFPKSRELDARDNDLERSDSSFFNVLFFCFVFFYFQEKSILLCKTASVPLSSRRQIFDGIYQIYVLYVGLFVCRVYTEAQWERITCNTPVKESWHQVVEPFIM